MNFSQENQLFHAVTTSPHRLNRLKPLIHREKYKVYHSVLNFGPIKLTSSTQDAKTFCSNLTK